MTWSLKRVARRFGMWMVAGAVLASVGAAVAFAATAGVRNPGFEDGLAGWTGSAGAADAAVVVGIEGPADFPVYASRGVTVTPRAGRSMLRLGTPRPKGSQPKGVTTVSQTFTPTAPTMRLAVRVFSWEFRGSDAVVIDLIDAAGRPVGSCERPRSEKPHSDTKSGLPFVVTMTDGTVRSHGKMPIEISPRSVLRNALMDTGWLVVDIRDLPVGTPLTLSYSLRTPKDSSHPTWAYFDEVNDPPTAADVSFRTDKNKPLSVSAPGVLAGAVDPDGDVLDASLVTPTEHGMLTLRADGAFAYAPDYGFVGTDSFTFRAGDGQSFSDEATATIGVDLVNDAPRPAAADVLTDEDTSVHVTLPWMNANGDRLTYSIVGPPANGQLTADAVGDGNLEYSPNPHYSGWDSFTYYATDGLLYWDVGTIWIEVRLVNHAPVALALEAKTNEGTPVELTLSASDREGDAFTFEIVGRPMNGQLSAIAGDRVAYTPNESFYGVDTFTYRAIDATAGPSVTATVIVDPLVAMFDYAPTDAREGEYVFLFGDLSHVVDPDRTIVSWDWSVAGPNGFTDLFASEASFFTPEVEGSYDVTLTVTDSSGAYTTTHTIVPVANDRPRVKALNLEVMPGKPATILGRFLDAGWTDSHTAVVNAPGTVGVADLAEDHVAEISSGIVTAPVTTIVGGQGILTVTDDGGGTTDVGFDVTVVEPGTDRSPENYTLANRADPAFPKARGDGSYLSYIKTSGDVDLYEVLMPDGSALPYGTEVLASIKELPADYDLAILSELPSSTSGSLSRSQVVPFQQGFVGSAPTRTMPTRTMPTRTMPTRTMPTRTMPTRTMPTRTMPTRTMPTRTMPTRTMPTRTMPTRTMYGLWDALRILEFPLSEMSYTGLDTGGVGASDITLSDLALTLPAGADIAIAAVSANRGTANEAALARTESLGNRIYIAVFGANGAFDSGAPYRLEVETSQPLDLASVFNDTTPPAPMVPAEARTVAPQILNADAPSGPDTLFVTQRERFVSRYGLPAWEGLETDLRTLCLGPEIKGEILSVPSGMYDAWDTDPRSVEAANAVAAGVSGEIAKRMTASPTIRYVVILGDDRIVPFRRVADDTLIGNEFGYRNASCLFYDSPLYASMAAYCMLTDDYYADAAPIPWQGRSLYVPDVAVGRLVETPDEIRGSIRAFTDRNGVLDPTTSLVTGYDFFEDGALAASETLSAARLSVGGLVGEAWTSGDLKGLLFGQTSDINNVNAHFSHYEALSANGWATYQWGDTLSSIEVSSAVTNGAPSLWNRLVLTLGCHAGLSVPDGDSARIDAAGGVDPALDMPQAMARQGAVYLANTGSGLGDTEVVACSELLNDMYLEQLLQNGGTTVGQALVEAKQRYMGSLSALTAYDEKTSVQFTLYGLPQYRVLSDAGPLANATGAGGSIAAAGWPLWPVSGEWVTREATFTLKVLDATAETTTEHEMLRVSSATGDYMTADGGTQASDSRAVQPKITIPLQPTTAGVVHGVLLGDGSFTEEEPFDPVIAATTSGWVGAFPENQVSSEGFWPASPATLTSIETTGLVQNLVVVPGQFRATSAADTTVTGVQRTWTSLNVDVLRSPRDQHWSPPTITGVALYLSSPTTVAVSVQTTDTEGIAKIRVSRITTAGLESTDLDVAPAGQSAGRYVVHVGVPEGSPASDLGFMIQVADTAGNVAVSTGKGATLHLVSVVVPLEQTQYYPDATPLTGYIAGYESLVQPVTFHWDFGDGETSTGVLPAVLPTFAGTSTASPLDGMAYFTVSHVYAAPQTARTAVLTVSDALGGTGQCSIVMSASPDAPGVVSPWIKTAGGWGHTVAIKSDGTLWAWGYNNSGQLGDGNPPFDVLSPKQIGTENTWVSVAAGWDHTLAIKSDGTLWAWGANYSGQLGDGTTTSRSRPSQVASGTEWTSVAASTWHSLAVRSDGTLYAWGSNDFGQLGDGTTTDQLTPKQIGLGVSWATVAAGTRHSLAVARDGSLWSWGGNSAGQLGDGTTATQLTPTPVGTEKSWVTATAGEFHTVGLKRDGTAWAWGSNGAGQLGAGTITEQLSPRRIDDATTWSTIAAGAYHTVGTRADGTLWAWGANYSGQLGDGTAVNALAPKQVGADTAWASASAGVYHTVGVGSDGTIWAWGGNSRGQVGDGTTNYAPDPARIGEATDWESLAAGYYHSLGITADGTLWAWGGNGNGQLGDGTNTGRTTPVTIGTGWERVTAGSYHSIGVKGGQLWAWGGNQYGQLGDGTNTTRKSPQLVSADTTWSAASASYGHTAAIKNGELWTWGWNSYGQLGDGTIVDRRSPSRVGTETGWLSVAAGDYHTVALKDDGSLWAWGYNGSGQLGDGSTTSSLTPVQVVGGSDWIAVATEWDSALALKSDRTLWTWGHNSPTPQKVGTDTAWAAIQAGTSHYVALKSDGSLWAWGSNWTGQIGDGTTVQRYVPKRIGFATDWNSAAAGLSHTLAIRNGELWAWGNHEYGQLGEGSDGNRYQPARVLPQ
jgi:alpha-tubulin suppressor-like RCC1 family protein